MANLANLNIGIGADLAGLQSGLSKAQKRITSFSEGVESRLGSISTDRLSSGLANIDTKAVPAANRLSSAMGGLQRPVKGSTQAVINFNRIVQDAPFGIIGVANNLEPMIQSFNQLKSTTGSTTGALKQLLTSAFTGPGALITIVSAASSLLLVFSMRMRGSKKEAEELTDSMDNLNSSWERTIDLQDQFGAFGDDELGIAKTQAQIREITEDIEEQQQQLREVNKLEERRRELQLAQFQTGLDDQQQQELDNINRQVHAYADSEQIQLRINDLTDRRQRLSEDLVNTSEALTDEDTKQAQQSSETTKSREDQLAVLKEMEDRIDPIAMGFTEWSEETEDTDKNLKAISVSLDNMPSVSDNFKEEDFPEGSLGAMNQQLQMMQAALQRLPAGSEAFNVLRDRIEDLKLEIAGTSQGLNFLTGIANTFTDNFGQGIANVIVQGQKLKTTLADIGKLLLSSTIQRGLGVLLTGGLGGSGFFGSGGGLLGKIFPNFHDGGVVPGPLGKERLILAQGGETVMTPQQMGQRRGGGKTTIQVPVYLDNRKIAQAEATYSDRLSR